MTKYRYIGNHPESLDNGRMLAPGDFANLSDDEVKLRNASSMIDDGKLIKVNPPVEKAKEGDKT